MSIDIGINFRNTAGYVTDGANQTYCLGDLYPTTRGGITFGYDSAIGVAVDRNNAIDVRLAGINATINTRTFQLDLPASGTYTFHLAMGDDSSAQTNCIFKLYDNSTLLLTVGPHNTNSGSFYDASDVQYTDTNWPGSETGVPVTFATTTCKFTIGNMATNTTLAHIRLFQAGGGSPKTIFPLLASGLAL